MSRRHQVGEGNTRSLLMTILGEFVLPTDQHVWTATLVHALTAAEGWLSPAEVEERLLQHPDIAEAAVVAAVDESGLEKPVACATM